MNFGGMMMNFGTMMRFLAEEDGPTAVEYAAMLALVVLAAAGAMAALGVGMGDAFRTIGDLAGR